MTDPEPRSNNQDIENKSRNDSRVFGDGSGSGGGGGGYGAGSYGANSSLDHVREYPANGLVPTGDGSLVYPSDVAVEQAANLGPISAFNANTALGKRDQAQKMYDESDRAAELATKAKTAEAARKGAVDWQSQRLKGMSALAMIANNSGTGQSGSYWENVMQAYKMFNDIQAVKAISTEKEALNQAYMEEAETKQQNQNARNELDIDTWAAIQASLSDYAAQLSSLNPGLASGVYGSEQNKTWNEDTPEDERPTIFPYKSKEGSTLTEDLYGGRDEMARKNGEEGNYRFAPIIDREGRTIIAPYWWPEFEPQTYEAITPRRAEYVRTPDDAGVIARLKNIGKTDKGSAATIAKNLSPYLAGYGNRSNV